MFEKYDEERVVYERKNDYNNQFVVTWKLVVAKTKNPQKENLRTRTRKQEPLYFFFFSEWYCYGSSTEASRMKHWFFMGICSPELSANDNHVRTVGFFFSLLLPKQPSSIFEWGTVMGHFPAEPIWNENSRKKHRS